MCRFSRTGPWKSWTSAKVKGVDSDLVPVYLPGRRRKKNAMAIIWATANMGELAVAAAAAMVCIRIGTGIGFTRLGGGSCLV